MSAGDFIMSSTNMLAPPRFQRINATPATSTHFDAAINLLLDPKSSIPADLRAALLKEDRAVASRDSGARALAIQALIALPEDQQNEIGACAER
jgi:hypothetical protein